MLSYSNSEIFSFFIAVLCGISLALIYDVFKAVRLVFKTDKIRIFFEDIFFSVICSFTTYFVMFLRTSGEIRWFILFAELFGFIIERCLISKLVVKAVYIIIRFIKSKLILPLSKLLHTIFKLILSKNEKILLKFKKICKNNLKTIYKVLYNKKNKNAKKIYKED